MTPLIETAQQMGLSVDASIWGRWIRFPGDHSLVYVREAPFGQGYYVLCDAPMLRTAELYRDPREAIEAGLRRTQARQSAVVHALRRSCTAHDLAGQHAVSDIEAKRSRPNLRRSWKGAPAHRPRTADKVPVRNPSPLSSKATRAVCSVPAPAT